MTTAERPAAKGSQLVPDVSQRVGVSRKLWFWVGALPGCPRESLDVAGISFPKMTELVRKDPYRPGATSRTARLGAVVSLTESRVRLLVARLPYCVIRFDNSVEEDNRLRERERAKCVTEEAMPAFAPLENTGGLEALVPRRRKGRPIRIPTPEEIASATANRIPPHVYVPEPNDEPVARYIFAMLCADQERPSRGEFYPEPLEVTGIEWPESPKRRGRPPKEQPIES